MVKGLLLSAAFAASTCGMAWLALAMDEHWRQVTGDAAPGPIATRVLRVLGTSALLASAALCFAADHASMAVLVWVMTLAAAALVVAFTLAWRPQRLALLAARFPRRGV